MTTDLLATIKTIVKSPLVEEYNVGLTIDSGRRRNQYRNFDPTWPHYVIIKSKLKVGKAVKLEEDLRTALLQDKRSIMYKKYRSDRRDGRHYPSLGGRTLTGEEFYDIYIAWGNKGDN